MPAIGAIIKSGAAAAGKMAASKAKDVATQKAKDFVTGKKKGKGGGMVKNKVNKETDIYIVDTYGETKSFYKICKSIGIFFSLNHKLIIIIIPISSRKRPNYIN